MKNEYKVNLRLSAISLAVVGLFNVASAYADDAEIKALTQPQSSVQVEGIAVDGASAKFGEYNGLNRMGAYGNGALNVRGGSAYTGNEQGDTMRWSVTGDNLGLTSRSANASVSDQGSWNFGINYDQLQHNTSDSYQTPYRGSLGGSTFSLPSGFTSPVILKGSSTSTSASGTQALTSDQKSAFSGMQISNTRYNTTVNGTAIVNPNLNITFEYNNLIQTGAKLGAMGSSSATTGIGSQGVSILPMPTNSQTDTVNLAVNWKDENSHLAASYFGSFFQNGANGVSAAQWYGTSAGGAAPANTFQTLSTMPNNVFNQMNLAGGYDFSSKTKLTANASMGQNTQNQGFGGSYDTNLYSGGQTSMNGVVNTTHLDAKLTDNSVKDLTLTALAKLDERDNLTQSNSYTAYSLATTPYTVPNTPMSIKQTQLGVGGDYRLTKDQKIGLTLANNAINRWCNQFGGSGSSALFLNSSSCVTATSSNENKADVNYKIKAAEDLNFKVAAGYANRKTEYNSKAYVAMPSGYVNNGNVLGYQPFFEASRRQVSTKANADWKATEDLGFTLGGKYTIDTYPDSVYGVQNGFGWSLNFDTTYAYSQEGTISAYATQQNLQRTFVSSTSLTPTAATNWTNQLNTNTTTLGISAKQNGLADGKLGLTADMTYSVANSIYTTGSGVGGACPAASSGQACGTLPGIQNNLAIVKLGGNYQLDKNQKIGLMYWWQHLYSNDFYYNGYAMGTSSAQVLPTNQTAPSYNINVFMANYTYTFD